MKCFISKNLKTNWLKVSGAHNINNFDIHRISHRQNYLTMNHFFHRMLFPLHDEHSSLAMKKVMKKVMSFIVQWEPGLKDQDMTHNNGPRYHPQSESTIFFGGRTDKNKGNLIFVYPHGMFCFIRSQLSFLLLCCRNKNIPHKEKIIMYLSIASPVTTY